MKNEDFKKLIERSEIKTSADFTVKLMDNIKLSELKPNQLKIWSLWKVVIGFILISGLTIFGCYFFQKIKVLSGSLFIPVIVSLILLVALNHLIVLNKWHQTTSIE
ncbi:hypothetical protein [Christiangramia salexigens]|uniref:Uncharacterized protein n=1 Tax=Christiangramia salexigens TaxID=1913577 RepID=A0A1L3J3Z0_9FLAO|nr:hypothetical protein [Christiangramia salexigens]APG59841.1 hypothetical protein LPB144_05165 [Christiangramia salexigens]